MSNLKSLQFRASRFLYEHRGILVMLFILFLCFDGTVSLHATTELGKSIEKGSTNLLQEVEGIFCGSLAYLLFAIEIAVFLISKNDKAKRASVVSAIGTVVAYIVLKVLASSGGGAIGKTMDEMTEWVQ